MGMAVNGFGFVHSRKHEMRQIDSTIFAAAKIMNMKKYNMY